MIKISRDPNWSKPASQTEPASVNISKTSVTSISSDVKAHCKREGVLTKVGNCLMKYDNMRDFVLAMQRENIEVKITDFFPVSGFFALDLYMISEE